MTPIKSEDSEEAPKTVRMPPSYEEEVVMQYVVEKYEAACA